MTVVEMPEFRRQVAAALLNEEEILDLVTRIAKDPKAGEVVTGTGGVRKLRFAVPGRGKSGGARAIYVYYSEELPVFLLTCFPKNKKTDLTQAEKREMRKLVPALRVAYEAGLKSRIRRARAAAGKEFEHGTFGEEEQKRAQG